MGNLAGYSGTFTSADLVDGVLTITYVDEIEHPIDVIIVDDVYSYETRRYDVEKIDNNNCEVNLGEEYQTGTWEYTLYYAD